MGKFDGYLLCSDIDGTLITSDHRVSKGNLIAINYFKDEGGIFALATGRAPQSVNMFLNEVRSNAPMIVQNGAGIYDHGLQKHLWTDMLDTGVYDAVKYLYDNFPEAGIEINTINEIYVSRENYYTEKHRQDEHLPYLVKHYTEIDEPIMKILTSQDEAYTYEIEKAMRNTPFYDKYKLVVSSANYFEVLKKGVNKGNALIELARILNIDMSKTIAIGDNDNDVEMIKTANIGATVSNASEKALQCADMVVASNNENAIADLISRL